MLNIFILGFLESHKHLVVGVRIFLSVYLAINLNMVDIANTHKMSHILQLKCHIYYNPITLHTKCHIRYYPFSMVLNLYDGPFFEVLEELELMKDSSSLTGPLA